MYSLLQVGVDAGSVDGAEFGAPVGMVPYATAATEEARVLTDFQFCASVLV
jgi:hypothetical protein